MPKDDAFEKARFDYLVQVYDRQLKRLFELDNKGRFYFSFGTLLLGAIVLNFSLVADLNGLITAKSLPDWGLVIITIITILFATSLFSALFAVTKAVALKSHRNEFPDNISDKLFNTSDGYLEQHDLSGLYEGVSLGYARAIEELQKAYNSKIRWLDISTKSILFSVVLLAIGIATVSVIQWYH